MTEWETEAPSTEASGPEVPSPEVPIEDALEQAIEVEEHEPEAPPTARPDEADPGDLAEQARPVELDDDEYR